MPEWIKSDAKISRQITAYGKLLDVMSPNSRANLGADKHAFAALMRHIREMDSTQHTVIMMQVGDESGGIGTVRDYSAAAQKLSAANVPESLTLRRIASQAPGSRSSVQTPTNGSPHSPLPAISTRSPRPGRRSS